MRTHLFRIGVIGLAACAAVLPVSPDAVEQFYSRGIYPRLQSLLTAGSNLTTFAWLDVLILGIAVAWIVLAWRDCRSGWLRGVTVIGVRTATWAAVLYLFFLAAWGLNYRRVSLEDRLGVDYRSVTPDAALALTEAAVNELNRLYPKRAAGSQTAAVLPSLADAFVSVQHKLGHGRTAVPGRPKHTIFDFYLRAASVDGMTDPFFLETLTLGTLLPVERPLTIAHEWAHLAGYADEGDANFVGWLVCLEGSDVSRYSAWLFLYGEAGAGLDRGSRAQAAARLGPGPRADLAAIAARVRNQSNPVVATVGWQMYDQYLKANGVERGTRSYTDVVRLILGTPLGKTVTAAIPARAPAAGSGGTSTARP